MPTVPPPPFSSLPVTGLRTLGLLLLLLVQCQESSQVGTPPLLQRLLHEPGARWQVEGEWYRQELDPRRPEADLTPHTVLDFERGLSEWIVMTDPAPHGGPGEAARSLPWVDSASPGAIVRSPPGWSAVSRVVPVSPLTDYVITAWVKSPEQGGHAVTIQPFQLPPEDLGDADAVTAALQNDSNKTALWAMSRDQVEILETREDGFELWRFEPPAPTLFGVESLLVGLLSITSLERPESDTAAFGTVTVFELGLRDALAWNHGYPAIPSVETLDLERRTAAVRRDSETRPALLLPLGGQAQCRVTRRPEASSLRTGLCILPEDRLARFGPCRVEVNVEVIQDSQLLDEQSLFLEFDPRQPAFWTDVHVELPTIDAVAELELRVRVLGEDGPGAPLLALSDPLLRVEAQQPEWNLVMVSLDTFRADRLGRVRDGKSLTPHLDSLCAESLVFEQALSPASYTLPAHASLFMSQNPGDHGLLHPTQRPDRARSITLTELLAERGYETGAFTAGAMLNPEYCGVQAGFDRYSEIDPFLSDQDPLPQKVPRWDLIDYNRRLFDENQWARRVLPWLDQRSGAPFFLFLHTYLVHNYCPDASLQPHFEVRPDVAPDRDGPVTSTPLWEMPLTNTWLTRVDPHDPTEFHPPRDLPYLESLYDATVFQADREIGKLIDELRQRGLWDRTIFVVVSDHGEEFLEHGGLSHAHTLYEELLRVPWILRVPGMSGQRVTDPVSLIDVAPTLLALLEIPKDPRMQGRNVLAEEGNLITLHEGVERGATSLRSARSVRAKVILASPREAVADPSTLSPEVRAQLQQLGYLNDSEEPTDFELQELELYDLESDPGETRPLQGTLSESMDHEFRKLLDALLEDGP